MHCEQNAPVNRLQTISDIRQCPPNNNTHGIVKIRRPHLIFYAYRHLLFPTYSQLTPSLIKGGRGFYFFKKKKKKLKTPPPLSYTSRFFTSLALSSINFLRGST